MKKIGVIVPVVLLAVFGLLVMSCDDVYTTPTAALAAMDAKAAASAKVISIDVVAEKGTAGSYTLPVVDNFQYGEGYQGKIADLASFNSYGIKEDDEIVVEYAFTVSRAIAGELSFGFVDENADRDYWGPLTWDPDGEPDLVGANIANGASTSGTKTLYAGSDATDTNKGGKAYNTLFFQTNEKDGTKGSAGSGAAGTVNLTFTKLTIKLTKAD